MTGTTSVILLFFASVLSAARVAVIAGAGVDGPARYGLERLRESLKARGFLVDSGPADQADYVVLAGLGADRRTAAAISPGTVPSGPQALVIRRTTLQEKPAVVIWGSDPRGLMYAALDVADRVSWSTSAQDPFQRVRDASETPFLAERGISMYTMQRAYFESRLFDENYWKRYFDLLARSRINTFTVIFGYENGGFMAPLYPYFFDVPQHSEVRLIGITRQQQERNTAAFRTLIRIAHERAIDVIPAVWDHIYRGGVQGGGIAGASEIAGKEAPGLVAGVTASNLADYTKAALRRFVEVFPEIDGLEFRMHSESGLKREEMAGFWHEIFGIIAQARPGLRVTLRAKELPDAIIDDALRQGLNARVETKYWMEQMGMPFHPTHINRQNQDDRRHGYADLLTYPQRYRVHWRLWNGGTTRLLLWGDPEYARRFAASARLYDGNSIDVNEMLATKMLGEPHDKPPLAILNSRYRYYDYEFERYWHFYQVWGRVSFNPSVPPETWEEEFRRRFGPAGLSLMRGLHAASRVLPRIVAASYRYQLFPTTRGWAEMMRQGDLPQFAGMEGTDIEQFQNPRDAAKSMVRGDHTSLRRPEETSRWFAAIAGQILDQVRVAEQAGARGNEARSTIADLKILASLARYHAARLNAAVDYNLYQQTSDVSAFDRAISGERAAVSAWTAIVEAAGDVYSSDLAFGVHRVGFPRHWKEELEKLQLGLTKLVEERKLAKASGTPSPHETNVDRLPPAVRLDPVGKARPGRDLQVSAVARDASGVKTMRLRYRHLTQVEDYQTAEMIPDPESGRFAARIPGDFITPKWDLIYFIEAIDSLGNGRNYPDLETQAPYVIVEVERSATRATGVTP
jgi:hypothetical protein